MTDLLMPVTNNVQWMSPENGGEEIKNTVEENVVTTLIEKTEEDVLTTLIEEAVKERKEEEKTIGKAIKLLRELSGFSREAMAEELKIKESHLREIESGRRDPSFAVIKRAAEALKIKPSIILFFADDQELIKQFYPGKRKKPIEFRNALVSMLTKLNHGGIGEL